MNGRPVPFIDYPRRTTMGEMTSKIKGAANETAGKVKDAVGEATGNDKLEAEGEVQQLKGKGQKLKGDVEGALGDDV